MPALQLTKKQKIATSYDRHLSVNANAGSGKTFVLVNRYLNILLENLDSRNPVKPSEIVAITFTRKAAGEMRSKIVSGLEDRIKEETSPIRLKELNQLREKMTSARISTIHSFCSEIIRTYPVEAGVSPDFGEITDADLAILRKEALNNVLEDWLQSGDSNKAEKINNLISLFKKDDLINILYAIVDKREQLDKLLSLYNRSPDYLKSLRDEDIKSFMYSYANDFIRLNTILDKVNPESFSATIRSDFILWRASVTNYVDAYSSDNYDMMKDAIENYLIYYIKIFTKTGTARKNVFKGIDDYIIEALSLHHSQIINTLDELSESIKNIQYDDDMIMLSSQILELALEICSEFDEIKVRRQSLDFDDLILKSLELLKFPEINQTVRSRIKYLMIDEFQDTNQTQYDIVKLIVPELEIKSEPLGINLFIVGDWKQSIYGFRKADVKVFKQASREIGEYNADLIEKKLLTPYLKYREDEIKDLNMSESCGNIILDSSFRLSPIVAAFVNRLCGNLMSETTSEFDVSYEKLVCAKMVSKFLEEEPDSVNIIDYGSISFLVSSKDATPNPATEGEESQIDENSEASDEGCEEAELTARYIMQMIESDDFWLTDEKSFERRKIKYGDIAILSRKKNGFDALTATFLKYGIPFHLSSGKGFYDTCEIQDIASYLNFLVNQNDNLAFFSLLRSDYFNFSAEALFLIAKHKEGNSYWEKFENMAGNPSVDLKSIFDDIATAYNILRDFVVQSGTMSVSQIVQNLIEKTKWNLNISKYYSARQIRANIEKLVNIARDFENRGFNSLFDFAEFLNNIYDSESAEDEAVVNLDENSVKMLTIHAAKGLEFPVVIVYNLNTSTVNNRRFYNSERFGLAFNTPVMSDEGLIKNYQSPITYLSKLINDRKEEAESKRLLYVALTRAKEHLVLSAKVSMTTTGDVHKPAGFLKMLLSSLNIDAKSLFEKDLVDIDTPLQFMESNLNLIERLIKFKLNIIRSLPPLVQIVQSSKKVDDTSDLILKGHVKSSISNEHYSASRFMALISDKSEFQSKYVFGFPDEMNYKTKDVFAGGDARSGMNFGSLVHFVFEHINEWLDQTGNIDYEAVRAIQKRYEHVESDQDSISEKKVIDIIQKVISDKFIQQNLNSLLNAQKEFELKIPFESDLIIAKFDMMIQINGNFEIWDWKTNWIGSVEKIKELIEHYTLQMKVYLYFLSYLYPNQEKYTARLLFTSLLNRDISPEWIYEIVLNKNEIAAFETELNELITRTKEMYFS